MELSNIDPIFLGLLIIMAIGFAAMAIVFPMWVILHRVLSKLDGILLREPFFKKSEQVNCMVWPLSYWKTNIYIALIAAPSISRKKRFKGFNEPLPVGKTTVIVCKVQFFLMCFCGVLFLVYAGYLVFGLYIYPNL